MRLSPAARTRHPQPPEPLRQPDRLQQLRLQQGRHQAVSRQRTSHLVGSHLVGSRRVGSRPEASEMVARQTTVQQTTTADVNAKACPPLLGAAATLSLFVISCDSRMRLIQPAAITLELSKLALAPKTQA